MPNNTINLRLIRAKCKYNEKDRTSFSLNFLKVEYISINANELNRLTEMFEKNRTYEYNDFSLYDLIDVTSPQSKRGYTFNVETQIKRMINEVIFQMNAGD